MRMFIVLTVVLIDHVGLTAHFTRRPLDISTGMLQALRLAVYIEVTLGVALGFLSQQMIQTLTGQKCVVIDYYNKKITTNKKVYKTIIMKTTNYLND